MTQPDDAVLPVVGPEHVAPRTEVEQLIADVWAESSAATTSVSATTFSHSAGNRSRWYAPSTRASRSPGWSWSCECSSKRRLWPGSRTTWSSSSPPSSQRKRLASPPRAKSPGLRDPRPDGPGPREERAVIVRGPRGVGAQTATACRRGQSVNRTTVETRLLARAREQRGRASIPRRDRRAAARLSFAQQRLWLLDQLVPQSSEYVIPCVFRFRGSLDLAALESAFRAVAQRHEVLRTRFEAAGDESVQVIDPTSRIAPELVDISVIRMWTGGSGRT